MVSFRKENEVGRKALFLYRAFFVLACLLLFASGVYAQFSYEINGSVTKAGKRLDGAVVTLFKGSSQVAQVTTGGNGKFNLKLEQNFDYTMTVTKGGCITKKFFFSTKGMPDDVAKDFESGTQPEISIFETPKDPNVAAQANSILSQPMAKFMYDDRQKNI